MYATSNEVISELDIWGPGYLGTLSFESRDGTHGCAFSVSGKQVQKDGAPFDLDWNLAGFNQNPQFDQEINELHDALIATFAPGVAPSQSWQQQMTCVVGSFGDVAYVAFPEVGLTAWIASLSAGQPTCSTFDRLDLANPGPPPCPPPPPHRGSRPAGALDNRHATPSHLDRSGAPKAGSRRERGRLVPGHAEPGSWGLGGR